MADLKKVFDKLKGLKDEWSKAAKQADIVRKNTEFTSEAKNIRIAKITEDYKTLYLSKLQTAIDEANKQLEQIDSDYIASIPKLDIQAKSLAIQYFTGIIVPCGITKEIDYLYNNVKNKKGDIFLEITRDSLERIENTQPRYGEEGLSYESVEKLTYLKWELEGKIIPGKEDLEKLIQGTLNFLYSAGTKNAFCSSIEDNIIQYDTNF